MIQQIHRPLNWIVPVLLGMTVQSWAQSASFYTERLDDPRAVYVAPSSSGDDTAALQKALDQVQATGSQGIVLLAPGRYHIEKFPKVVDGGGWKKGILRGTKEPAAITRWRHNPQDTYGTEECSQPVSYTHLTLPT